MTFYLLIIHALNFMAPAAGLAVLMVLLTYVLAPIFKSNRPLARMLLAQAAIIFIATLLVAVLGLVVFGQDAKMTTYSAMVLVAAACQAWRMRTLRK